MENLSYGSAMLDLVGASEISKIEGGQSGKDPTPHQ
jgi:hypothetical protein